jgi:2,3-bisphosphoglycerate-dependent phosphoglycerate mutase
MKIYILRHEERTQDCSFFAPLTKNGLQRSRELVNILEQCNINIIYSSPFTRTLQTIYPYSIKKKIKINLEYGFSEIHRQDIIPIKAVGIHLPEYIAENFNYNPEYKSFVKPNQIKYPESLNNVHQRIKFTLKDIILKNINTDKNILIVTHQSLCNFMVKIHNQLKIFNYNTGQLCKIFDNDWECTPIN